MSSLPVLQNYLSVITHLKLKEIYLVGGSVRDILLKRALKDIDIALPSDSIDIARKFADRIAGSFFIMNEEEGVARVIKKDKRRIFQFDFALFKAPETFVLKTLTGLLSMLSINASADFTSST